jgi:uncharacterized membrane protein YgcG
MFPLRRSFAGHCRMMVLRACFALALLAGIAVPSAGQDTPVPVLKHYATDLSGSLSAEQVSQLDELLASFDKTTSTQVVVLMISSLNGDDLEEYSLRVAEANKIGRKGKDNGALLLWPATTGRPGSKWGTDSKGPSRCARRTDRAPGNQPAFPAGGLLRGTPCRGRGDHVRAR